jgi:hypothetical protein
MRKKSVLIHLAVTTLGVAGVLTGAVSPAAADVIDTSGGASAAEVAASAAAPSAGQTFSVGASNVMQDFSFWVGGQFDGPNPLTFKAYVMEWNGAPVGKPLYASGLQTKQAVAGFERFDFNANGLILDPNKRYVAFVQVEDFGSSPNGLVVRGANSTYDKGEFVRQPGSNAPWSPSGDDIAFFAEFVAPDVIAGGGAGAVASLGALSALVGGIERNAGRGPGGSGGAGGGAGGGQGGGQGGGTGGPGGGPGNPNPGPKQPEPPAIPTPALLPGLLGLGASVWRQRGAK